VKFFEAECRFSGRASANERKFTSKKSGKSEKDMIATDCEGRRGRHKVEKLGKRGGIINTDVGEGKVEKGGLVRAVSESSDPRTIRRRDVVERLVEPEKHPRNSSSPPKKAIVNSGPKCMETKGLTPDGELREAAEGLKKKGGSGDPISGG